MKKASRLLILMGFCALASLSTPASTLYVWQDSPSPGSGFLDWSTAAHTIQDAVDAAQPNDAVLVTNGVYATGGRAVYGLMTNRVAVDKPLTLQSVNGPQFTLIQGYQVPGTTNGDGAIRCVYLTNGATLLGFTLTNGATRISGNTYYEKSGGGVWCELTNATVIVSNCVLVANSAFGYGGGAVAGTLYDCMITGNSQIGTGGDGGGSYLSTLNDCTLTLNVAYRGGGAYGGTLNNCTLNQNSATLGGGVFDPALTLGAPFVTTLNDSTLTGNSARTGGGAGGCTLNNCTLTGNSASYLGGGAYAGTLNNCTLTGNSSLLGGGAYVGSLTNCTLTGNSASAGGGACGDSFGAVTLNNCVVYHNTSATEPNYSTNCSLNYSCTTPMPTNGYGNITNEPAFVDPASGDFHLQPTSPCINAGNNTYVTSTNDLDGNPRIALGTVDMGAYEYQGPGSTISYAWLQQYGLPTDGSADLVDTDGDLMNNWQEWQADTNPTNAASAFRISLLSASPSASVGFSSSSNRLYTLLSCSNLTVTPPGPAWKPVSGQTDRSGTGSLLTLSDTNPPSNGFYRVSVRFP